jgi:hypothetical protein
MQLSLPLLLASGAAGQLAGQRMGFVTDPFGSMRKRQLMTCEQTYGSGSINCGASTFCYNPAAGQSCCQVDFGYCDKGSYCAPVAGFCCLENESLQDCARLAGFDLPGTVTQSLTTTITIARNTAATISPVTISVGSVTIATISPPSAASTGLPLVPVVPVAPTTGAGLAFPTGVVPSASRNVSRPFVITAGAVRSDRNLLWASVAVGSIAALMAFA